MAFPVRDLPKSRACFASHASAHPKVTLCAICVYFALPFSLFPAYPVFFLFQSRILSFVQPNHLPIILIPVCLWHVSRTHLNMLSQNIHIFAHGSFCPVFPLLLLNRHLYQSNINLFIPIIIHFCLPAFFVILYLAHKILFRHISTLTNPFRSPYSILCLTFSSLYCLFTHSCCTIINP